MIPTFMQPATTREIWSASCGLFSLDSSTHQVSLFADPFADGPSAPIAGEAAFGAGARKGGSDMWGWEIRGGVWQRTAVDCLVKPLTEEDRERLAAGSRRRGVLSGDMRSRRVKRSAHQEALLESLCGFVDAFGVDIMGAVTFRPSYTARHHTNTLARAVADVHQGLRQMPMNHGKRVGFRGRMALAGEWHRETPDSAHVHFLLSANGEPHKSVCEEVWQYFYSTRGRTRAEPIVQLVVGTRYALKDVLKQTIEHPEALELFTTKPKRVKCYR